MGENMEGVITKILSDKCEIKIKEEVVTCGIRGKLKKGKLLPLVGDKVIIDPINMIIEKILPRKNELIRPKVCNVTMGLIVQSLKEPELDCNLIDKILVELEFNHIKPVICFTKKDLLTKDEYQNLLPILNYYGNLYPIYFNDEINKIKKIFKNEITVLIGQTGAGKSTLLNKLDPCLSLPTGEISRALSRGKHTTRHVSMLPLLGGYILDSPGFSALEFDNMKEIEIRDAFIEFEKYSCPYRDCMHTKESDCRVKDAVNKGLILNTRYDNYISFLKTAYKKGENKRRV